MGPWPAWYCLFPGAGVQQGLLLAASCSGPFLPLSGAAGWVRQDLTLPRALSHGLCSKGLLSVCCLSRQGGMECKPVACGPVETDFTGQVSSSIIVYLLLRRRDRDLGWRGRQLPQVTDTCFSQLRSLSVIRGGAL